MTELEVYGAFLKRYVVALQKVQRAKGIRASGRSGDQLRIVTEPKGGAVFGKDYIHFQKVGRRPGKFPPIDAILQWITEKGIRADIPERQLAFLIARKISRQGTDIFMKKRPALDMEEELLEARKELVINFGQLKKQELMNNLKQVVKAAQ